MFILCNISKFKYVEMCNLLYEIMDNTLINKRQIMLHFSREQLDLKQRSIDNLFSLKTEKMLNLSYFKLFFNFFHATC